MSAKRRLLVGASVLAALPVAGLLGFLLWMAVADLTNGSLVSSGRERQYLMHVPTSYDPASPTPLVISLHGAALWPAAQRRMSGWNEVADEHGFIVVYPAGAGRPRAWYGTPDAMAADVRFISELIDTLETTFHIDRSRIFANGLSNGGRMTFLLSCTLADRLAAVGTVGAAYDVSWSVCEDPSPMPLISFHGTADRIVPFEGGKTWVAPMPFPGIRGWTERWARRNGCSPDPVESDVADDVTRVEFVDCEDAAPVLLYVVHEGGHTWPGGDPMIEWLTGRTTRSIDATRLMWTFFEAHPRGAGSQVPGTAPCAVQESDSVEIHDATAKTACDGLGDAGG